MKADTQSRLPEFCAYKYLYGGLYRASSQSISCQRRSKMEPLRRRKKGPRLGDAVAEAGCGL